MCLRSSAAFAVGGPGGVFVDIPTVAHIRRKNRVIPEMMSDSFSILLNTDHRPSIGILILGKEAFHRPDLRRPTFRLP
jgi:hypothetical protein